MSRAVAWWRAQPTWVRVLLVAALALVAIAVAASAWELLFPAGLGLVALARLGTTSAPAPSFAHPHAVAAADGARRAADRVEAAAADLAAAAERAHTADIETDRALAAAAERARAEAANRAPGAPVPTSTFLDRLSRRPGSLP